MYVTGYTLSDDFRRKFEFQSDYAGLGDGFVACIDTSLSGEGSLIYSSYLGGEKIDEGYGIAVDATAAYLTGRTESINLPRATSAIGLGSLGGSDVLVARIEHPGPTNQPKLDWLARLGSSLADHGYGIALYPNRIYVTGATQGSGFPVTSSALQGASNGMNDVFVAVLDMGGESDLLYYATYLGSSGEDIGRDIAVDSAGLAFLTGWTSGNFPVTYTDPPFTPPSSPGPPEAFAVMLQPFPAQQEDVFQFSVLLGGSKADYGRGVGLDGDSNLYVCGVTESTNFLAPDTTGTPGGASDAFVTKLSPWPVVPAGPTVRVTATKDAAEAGPVPGQFTISRTGPTTLPLTVHFQVGGSATAGSSTIPGSDYVSIGTSVQIPAGEKSATVPVTPLADSEPEGEETVLLTLVLDPVTPGSYNLGIPGSGTVTIADSKATLPPNFVPHSFAGQAGGEGELIDTTAGAAGASSAAAVPGAFSPTGVRYADGTVRLVLNEFGSASFGTVWGQTRGWTNGPGYDALSFNGVGMVVSQLPRLLQGVNPSTLALVSSGTIARTFDQVGATDTYQARHFLTDRLVRDPDNQKVFVLTDSTGNRFRFHDFSAALPNQRGRLISVLDPFGNATEVYSQTEDGKVQEVRRSYEKDEQLVIESYVYHYYGQDPKDPANPVFDNLLQHVELRRQIGKDKSFATVRRVDYSYYDKNESHGNVGDLKTATVTDGTEAIDASYYRYYTSDSTTTYQHGLKMAFGWRSFARLRAAFPGTSSFDALMNTDVAPYADHYFQEYDDQRRVKKVTVQGLGSTSGPDGGRGTFTYAYDPPSGHPNGYNNWRFKVVERQVDPGGNPLFVHTVYSNYAGQVMLQVFESGASGSTQQWRTFHRYDAKGRRLWMAYPSAVTGFNANKADLLDEQGNNYMHLADGTGLIELVDYHGSTTATATVAGAVAGYVHKVRLAQGETAARATTGPMVTQSKTAYFSHTDMVSNAVIFPVGERKVFHTEGEGGPQTTRYGYSWHLVDGPTMPLETARVQSVTITYPVVSQAQNGAGTSDVETIVSDIYGRPIWRRDPDNFLHYTEYDQATGAVTKTITDVKKMSLTPEEQASLPTGWDTPAGGGLHLLTRMQVDHLGRTTKLTSPENRVTYTVYRDPQHEVRTYQGRHDAGMPFVRTGPTLLTREDRPGSYVETLTTSVSPDVVGNGPPTGQELIFNPLTGQSFLQSLARTYVSRGGQVVHSDRYFNLSGFNYGPAPNLGTLEVGGVGNYYRTTFEYDARGRQNRVQSHTGTVSRTDYDLLSRGTAVWVGTSDSNVTQLTQNVYDHGGAGDSNLTRATQFPSGNAVPPPSDRRDTDYFYDWRNRLVATKGGGFGTAGDNVNRPILYQTLDNLGRPIEVEQFHADGVSVATVAGVPVKPAENRRRARTVTAYDDQGRVFRTQDYNINQDTGALVARGAFVSVVTTDSWYNRRGLLIKLAPPRGLVTKIQYDGAGRSLVTYQTDGRNDTTWAHAGSVADDLVLSQTETLYDRNSNGIRLVSRERFHNESPTRYGMLSDRTGTAAPYSLANPGPKARVSYSDRYDDDANRLKASVEFGTNGTPEGSNPLVPLAPVPFGTPPPRSDKVLVSSYGYAADEVQRVAVSNPTGGVTFTLTFGGQTTSPALPGNASANDVQQRLEQLSSIGMGNVHVAGPNGGPWLVRFVGTRAGQDQAQLTGAGSAGVTIRTDSQGGDAGRVQALTNPRSYTSRTDHDLLGRTLRTLEAYGDFVPSNIDDRTVELTHDGSDHVQTRTHWLPGWTR